MRSAVFTAVLGILTAASAQAQMHGRQAGSQGEHMGGQGMSMMPGPVRSYMAFDPATLLERAESLDLTEQQITALTELQQATEHAVQEAHAPAHAAMQALMTELEAEQPDTMRIRELFSAHHIAMGNMQWIRLEHALQARAVLTAAQIAIVTAADDAPGHRMRHGQPGDRQ